MDRRATSMTNNVLKIQTRRFYCSRFPSVAGKHSGRLRAGYTLVEMVVILGITATLMSLAGVTFQKSVRVHQLAVKTLLTQQQIDAMRWRLKSDLASAVHIAHDGNSQVSIDVVTASSSRPRPPLHARNGDPDRSPSRIVYQWDGDRVTRTAFSADQELQSKLTWPLPVKSIDIEVQENASASLATFRLQFAEQSDVDSSSEFLWVFRLPRIGP